MDEDRFTPREFGEGLVNLTTFIVVLIIFKIVMAVQSSAELSSGERLILIVVSGLSLIFAIKEGMRGLISSVCYPLQEYFKTEHGKRVMERMVSRFRNRKQSI